MTVGRPVLLVHLHVVALVMAALVLVNLMVPHRFGWRDELARLSLLNRQIVQAHVLLPDRVARPVCGAAADLRRGAARPHTPESRRAGRV